MTGRPDYADRGGEPARMAAGRHERCICNRQPCICKPLSAPSPGFRFRQLRPLFWSDLLLIVEVLQGVIAPKFDLILKEIRIMGAREDAADARTAELIELVRQHEAALKAENESLKAALASADADKAAALEAESDADAGRQEAFNSALDELAGNAAPPVEEPPADGDLGDPEPQPVGGE